MSGAWTSQIGPDAHGGAGSQFGIPSPLVEEGLTIEKFAQLSVTQLQQEKEAMQMSYRDNICTGTTSGEAEKEYAVRVPDQGNLILLLELARARGIQAYVPRGSRKRVVLQAS